MAAIVPLLQYKVCRRTRHTRSHQARQSSRREFGLLLFLEIVGRSHTNTTRRRLKQGLKKSSAASATHASASAAGQKKFGTTDCESPCRIAIEDSENSPRLPVRRARAYGDFRPAHHFEVVAPLRVDGACARARAENSADGSALAAARDCADDRAHSRADGRALLCRPRLTVVAHRALVINLHGLAV